MSTKVSPVASPAWSGCVTRRFSVRGRTQKDPATAAAAYAKLREGLLCAARRNSGSSPSHSQRYCFGLIGGQKYPKVTLRSPQVASREHAFQYGSLGKRKVGSCSHLPDLLHGLVCPLYCLNAKCIGCRASLHAIGRRPASKFKAICIYRICAMHSVLSAVNLS